MVGVKLESYESQEEVSGRLTQLSKSGDIFISREEKDYC